MDISLPEDLIKIIEQIIIYEDMLKENEEDNFQYDYAYIEDIAEDTEQECPTIIKIDI